MEEKRQQREKQNRALKLEMQQEEERMVQENSPQHNNSISEGVNDVVRTVFSPPKNNRSIDVPFYPAVQSPMSPSHRPYFTDADTSVQSVINMDLVLPNQGPTPNFQYPAATAPAQTQDNSEQCIEYLNVLCQRLMDKQEELTSKVVSQEDEIKNLVAQNKSASV